MASKNGQMVYERWWIIEYDGGTYYVRAWDEETARFMFELWLEIPVEVSWLRRDHGE